MEMSRFIPIHTLGMGLMYTSSRARLIYICRPAITVISGSVFSASLIAPKFPINAELIMETYQYCRTCTTNWLARPRRRSGLATAVIVGLRLLRVRHHSSLSIMIMQCQIPFLCAHNLIAVFFYQWQMNSSDESRINRWIVRIGELTEQQQGQALLGKMHQASRK